MPTFRYTAKDMEGKATKGKLDASDRKELVSFLRGKNQYLITCQDITENEKNTYKMKLKELSEFSRQISTMLKSGVSLIRAMSILVQREEKEKPKKIYKDIYVKLQQGYTMSAAMQEAGNAFPELMINMYRSGESSGHMDQVALTMAKQYEKDYKIKAKVRNAAIYPIVLICTMLFVGIIVFTWIVPKFVSVFGNAQLPLITRVVMGISDVLMGYWYWILIIILSIVAIGVAILRKPEVRYKVDEKKLQLPLIGKLLKVIYTARFARTMCSLYTSGISILNGLMIVRTTIGNTYIEKQFDGVINAVRNGTSLSQSVGTIKAFDMKLGSSIFIGEESGRLDEMLTQLADDFDYEAEIAAQKMTTVFEPIMIITMAVLVLIVMLAVLLPVINMYNDPSALAS